MNWTVLFLSADGRAGRKDFWLGTAALFVANMVLGPIPLIGLLFHLASIWFGTCLTSRRLHDFGVSGWLAAVPYGVGFAATALVAVTSGAAIMTALLSGDGAVAFGQAMLALGAAGLIFTTAFLINLAFLLWTGLSSPTPGENAYGPQPGPVIAQILG